jgi:endoglucanase
MTTDLDFLRELCAAPAPTGFEAPAQEVLRRRLSALGAPQGDPLGNVWADVNQGGAPHIVVTAHNDQIGLIVTFVDEKGFVSFDKIGGVDAQLLPGRNLVVHTSSGPVNGIVGRKPSHKMSKEERAKAPEITDQWLDIGASSRDEALALVQIGDAITFPAAFIPLAGGLYASPAFDNRAGVYVCARALEHYAAAPAAAMFTALATVHEETTFMGAKAMATRWQPDVVIVVDVDFASDDPGMDAKKLGGEVKLGAGPVIHRGAGSNLALAELAREVAAAEGIPVQIKAMPGATSTDAEEFMASGQAATLSFSLPVRNMHSAFEVMQPDDAEAGALLAAGIARRLASGWDRERFVPRA